VLTPDEQWVIAVHEAAHAVVLSAIGQNVAAQKLSIVARGRQLGTAASMFTDRDATVMQEPDMRRHLIAMVAGYAAERIEFGVVSSGVHDDLHSATALARQMVTSYGMSRELGAVTIGEKAGEVFLGASLQDLGSVGPATLDLIDREVERIVAEAVEFAEAILLRNWTGVVETAESLIEHETLSGHALDAVLSTVEQTTLTFIDGKVSLQPEREARPETEAEREARPDGE
jgi:cell division protease FtsH